VFCRTRMRETTVLCARERLRAHTHTLRAHTHTLRAHTQASVITEMEQKRPTIEANGAKETYYRSKRDLLVLPRKLVSFLR
jgi:hypothetical protein